MGDPAARMVQQLQVVEMLRQMEQDATHIYILGDLFDFWYEYVWPDSSKREYEPVLEELSHITRELHIPVDFFIGNHDIWTFGWLEKRTGMTIHRGNAEEIKPEGVTGVRIIAGHGDGLVPSDYMDKVPKEFRGKLRRFIRLRKFFHSKVPQMLFRLVPPVLGNAYGYNWAKHSRLKEMAKPYPYKGDDKEEVVLWAREQEGLRGLKGLKGLRGLKGLKGLNSSNSSNGERPTIYIFGHRHVAKEVEIGEGSRLYLLGETFKQWTFLTMEEVAKEGSENSASELIVKTKLQHVSTESSGVTK